MSGENIVTFLKSSPATSDLLYGVLQQLLAAAGDYLTYASRLITDLHIFFLFPLGIQQMKMMTQNIWVEL